MDGSHEAGATSACVLLTMLSTRNVRAYTERPAGASGAAPFEGSTWVRRVGRGGREVVQGENTPDFMQRSSKKLLCHWSGGADMRHQHLPFTGRGGGEGRGWRGVVETSMKLSTCAG